MSAPTIEERLDALEGVLGLGEVECRGHPDRCGDICTPDACFLQNNLITAILGELREQRQRGLLSRAVVKELESAGIISSDLLERAELRVQCALTGVRLTQATETLTSMRQSGGSSTLLELAARRVEQIQDDLNEIEARLRG